MQTIARANRVFPGKHSGLIVDYANVFASLERALAIYGAIRTPSCVEAKIVPQERGASSFILIGVRPEWPLNDWSGLETRGHKVMDQGFRFIQLPGDEVEAARIGESVMTNLHEALSEPGQPADEDACE